MTETRNRGPPPMSPHRPARNLPDTIDGHPTLPPTEDPMPKIANSPAALNRLDRLTPVILVAGPLRNGADWAHIHATANLLRTLDFSVLAMTDLLPRESVVDGRPGPIRRHFPGPSAMCRFAGALVLTSGWEGDPPSERILGDAQLVDIPAFDEDDLTDLLFRYREPELIAARMDLELARKDLGVILVNGRPVVAPRAQLDRLRKACVRIGAAIVDSLDRRQAS